MGTPELVAEIRTAASTLSTAADAAQSGDLAAAAIAIEDVLLANRIFASIVAGAAACPSSIPASCELQMSLDLCTKLAPILQPSRRERILAD